MQISNFKKYNQATVGGLMPRPSVTGQHQYHILSSKNELYKRSTRAKFLSPDIMGPFLIFLAFLSTLLLIWSQVFEMLIPPDVDYESQWLSPQARVVKTLFKGFMDSSNLTEKELHNIIAQGLKQSTKIEHAQVTESVIFEEQETMQSPVTHTQTQCDQINVNMRFDCLPDGNASPQACERRGCCWKEVTKEEILPKENFYSKLRPSYLKKSIYNFTRNDLNVPYCFYPVNYSLYNATDIKYESTGIHGTLRQLSSSGFEKDVPVLQLEIRFETCSRVRVRLFDPRSRRWETPIPAVPDNVPGCHGGKMYDVQILPRAEIVVSRSATSELVFDMRKAAPLIYSDQYLQLSTILPSPFVYGLGQHLDGLLLDTYWKRKVLWNVDAIPAPDSNLYGSHPFYIVMEQSGSAHGVFLLNSNAIDVILQPTPALTFRAIGGILDFYVFLGPTPDDVISQYTEVVGRPFLPPYWSLGYHQCRFGYKTLEETKKVWNRTRQAGIPFDVQWNDIDYMRKQNDFTYDHETFAGLPLFVEELHELGMHYVIMTDPGISAGETPGEYLPFDLGMKDDVFIKNSSGDLFIGKVWNPLATVFPDFTRPNSVIYWNFLINNFREEVAFDGLWIDMNEPSNFWDGQRHGCPQNSSVEHPPYLPGVAGGQLYHKTLCMTAKQYLGRHYDIHNLYGISEAAVTYVALGMKTGIADPFIISRSSFPGLGAFAGHWTGDVYSDWFDLWKSIGDVLTTNLLGIPMVGADICGFNGNTTATLCNRWMQLGAFYPFSRNHNTDNGIDQDPVAMGETVVKSSRKALMQRYALLPFLFTLFVKAHKTGIPVARPLFFKYPEDRETYAIDTQLLWGNELMIVPVLEEDVTSVEAYIPKGRWYDWYSGKIVSMRGSTYQTLFAPADTIPLLVAGGSILPCQNPGNTTVQSRKNPFGVVVALDEYGKAGGELAWNKPSDSDFIQWQFEATPHRLVLVSSSQKPGEENIILDWIKILGVSSPVTMVTVNGRDTKYSYSAVSQVIQITNLSLNFKERVSVYYF